jgi:hypothetical protein
MIRGPPFKIRLVRPYNSTPIAQDGQEDDVRQTGPAESIRKLMVHFNLLSNLNHQSLPLNISDTLEIQRSIAKHVVQVTAVRQAGRRKRVPKQ